MEKNAAIRFSPLNRPYHSLSQCRKPGTVYFVCEQQPSQQANHGSIVNNKIDKKTTHPNLNTKMQTLTPNKPLKFVTNAFPGRNFAKARRLQDVNMYSKSVVNIETVDTIARHRPARCDCPITLTHYLPGNP